MRGLVKIATAILLATGLAQPVLAQGVDPTSGQNVVPTAKGDRAALDARRKALFTQMLRDPGDLDIAFAYAELSVALGDLEGAIATLERMLIFAPGLARLQFELGVLYFRLGAYPTAASYLDAVAASSDVPADVRQQVALYQQAIAERSAGSRFSGVVSAGARYQSNANAGPSDAVIDINGLPFLLNADSLGTPDTNAFVAANLAASIDLESQGDRFDAALSAYGAVLANRTELNTGTVELNAGPTFNLQRFAIDNASLGIYGIAGGAILGGDPYLWSLGAGTTFTALLDARSRLVLRGEGRYERFLDSAARPNVSARSGQRYTGAATYSYQASPELGLFATLTSDRRIADEAFFSSWTIGGVVGANLTLASPIAMLEAPWTFSLSLGVTHKAADGPDLTISPDAEATTQFVAQGALTVPLDEGFAVQIAASYLTSSSNYALSAYDNATLSIGLSKRF